MTQKQLLFNAPVPKGWQVITVNEIKANEPYSCVAGPFGSNISSKYFVDAGVPVIRGGNLTVDSTQFVPHNFVFVSEDKAKSFKAQHVKAGDLVFTCWGTLGQVGLIPNNSPYPEYIISNKQLKLRPNKEISDERFLYYYFATSQMVQYIRDISIGAAVPGINLGLLKAIKIVLPPLPIQKKIVAIVSAYDDLIENNDRRITLLEKTAEEIYREWFVRLRFPGFDRATFHKGIPEGWEVKSLSDICILQSGYAFKSVDFTDQKGEVTVVRMGNFKINNGLQFEDNVKFLTENVRVGEKFKLKAGDLLIVLSDVTRSGSIIGNIGVVPTTGKRYALNQRVSKIQIEDKYYFYIYGVLSSVSFKNHCLSCADSATVLNLSNKDFYEYKLFVPPDHLVNQFSTLYEPYRSATMNLSIVNQKLKQTRDRLLTRLISGKLSVEDLDIQFPPSMTTDA